MAAKQITAELARWVCNPDDLGFKDTRALEAKSDILGQQDAVDALQFGLETRIHGNNVFVRGLSGFGRMSLIDQMIKKSSQNPVELPDQCYVHNFAESDQPKLVELKAGSGKTFQRAMDRFAEFARTDLPEYLNSDIVKAKQRKLNKEIQEEIRKIGSPFDEELHKAGLAVVPIQVGQNTLPTILPIIGGKPVSFDELQQLRLADTVSEEEYKAIEEKLTEFDQKFSELGQEINNVQIKHREDMQAIIVAEAKNFVSSRINALKIQFDNSQVHEFLDEINDDLINVKMTATDNLENFTQHYRVNLIRSRDPSAPRPVVSVSNPNLNNLVGRIDQEFSRQGIFARSDHLMIKPGALLEANGGFLILEAQDILSEPGAWAALLRTLKTGLFEMGGNDPFAIWSGPRLRPKPIPIDIKVILVGNPDVYYLLNHYEPRFSSLFKVLADFADTIPRDSDGFNAYANLVARLIERDKLTHFSNTAVAKLIEHGSRICAQKNQLTSRFSRIADIAREAAFIAEKNDNELVTSSDVISAIRRTRRRADIPARRFRRLISDRTIKITFSGSIVGQINGLAVTSEGPLTFGFPTRITASIGPGKDGAINIERESDLSGSVHTKGFLILKGLIQRVLHLQHPLAFSASIAFEQTYGGIDGDSASAAEFCCLISALTNLPVRQSIALTGAVDQHGNILPIGGATEKIEGFYDACRTIDSDSTQGAIIPESNLGDLMLREDVVDSISAKEFTIYTISTIEDLLPILLERESGESLTCSEILTLAREKALQYWLATKD